MNRLLAKASLAAVILLAGCAANTPLTPQEEAFQTDRQSCTQSANSMIGPEGNWNQDMQWSSYFEWCMENKGYTKDQLKKIWY